MSERRANEVIQKITGSSTQPASPWRPQPQQYQDLRFSRGRGISHYALWLCYQISFLCPNNYYSNPIFFSSVLNRGSELRLS